MVNTPIGNMATVAAASPLGAPASPSRARQASPQPRPPNSPKQAPTPQAPQLPQQQPAQQAPQQPVQAAQGALVQPQQPKQGPAFAPPPKGVTRGQDAPIPGQSLTSKPGSFPYEKPPKYADPDKAMAAILNSVTDEKVAYKLLNLMEVGVPVYSIVTSFLISGFTEGKWSVDVALLLMEPFTALLLRMAEAAKITPEIGVPEDDDPTLEQVVKKRVKISEEQAEAAIEAASTEGIMPRPGKSKPR